MKHLYFFYFVITFSICFVTLGVIAAVYGKTKEKLLLSSLYFYSAAILSVGSNALLSYIRVNIPTIHPYLFKSLDYFEGFIAKYLLLFAIPVFAHALCSVPHATLKNVIFGGIVIITYIQAHFFEHVINDHDGPFERFGETIEDTMLVVMPLYAFIIGIYYFRKLQDPVRKRLVLKLLILLGIFLPGIIHDAVLSDFSPLRFSPVFYWGFSAILAHHFIKYYLHKSPVVPSGLSEQVSTNTLVDDDFWDGYDISPREKEVIALIIQGYSNQQIGETLYISLNTVKTHIRNIYQKLGIQSRHELFTLLNRAQNSPTNRSKDQDR